MKRESLVQIITSRFAAAIGSLAGTPVRVDPQVRPAGDPKFGDYQCNAAMALARELKSKPRDLAQRIVDAVELADVAEPLEIAGPGFINIRLRQDFLASYLGAIPVGGSASAGGGEKSERQAAEWLEQGSETDLRTLPTDRLGMPVLDSPTKVVVDYSSPNIAKQMHVGHVRSTIIGDVFARVLMFEGHEVVRQNHVGDWGTQFGMLITYYRDTPIPTADTTPDPLGRIEDGYRAAQEKFKSDETFAQEARAAVGRLQSGDPDARRVWERICGVSRDAFSEVYRRLGVLLTDDDVCGESFYDNRLQPVVEELRRKLGGGNASAGSSSSGSRAGEAGGVQAELRIDQGAECIFLTDSKGEPLFKGPSGDPLPLIIRKSDGAFLYATTDLAGVRYRTQELGATRIIYVTDARQKLHFQMFFAVAKAVGWAGGAVSLEHVTFGSVLGPDRRPLKTREGKNVLLRELLDEAERRSYEMLRQRELEKAEVARPAWEAQLRRFLAERLNIAPEDISAETVRKRLAAGAEQHRRAAFGNEEGTHSLKLLELVSELEQLLELDIPDHDAEDLNTVEDVLLYLAGRLPPVPDEVDRLGDEEMRAIARRIGVAAVKYADLRNDRESDYVFDWDKLLALQGNTAPYLLYAYARIRSIYRKASAQIGLGEDAAADAPVAVNEPAERQLALRLCRFRETIDVVASDLLPHVLCGYLYDLAADFMRFYEICPVLKAPDEATRLARMRLCDLTARTLKLGLWLLGIEAIERM